MIKHIDAESTRKMIMKERRLVFISHANPEDNEFASWQRD